MRPSTIDAADQGTINVGDLSGIGEAVYPEAIQGNTDEKREVLSSNVPGYEMLPDYIKQFITNVNQFGMGGRVKKYAYGGRGDPMTRALVGEYGPEEVKFIPGNAVVLRVSSPAISELL